jgi:hypothetical protein
MLKTMRDFKKYFFETLIQLTILANVFRQNYQPITTTAPTTTTTTTSNSNAYHFHSLLNNNFNISQGDYTEQDLLFLRENLNLAFVDNLNRDSYRAKEIQSYLNELNFINNQNQQLTRRLSIRRPVSQQQFPNIVIQPASAIYPNNNHKQIIDLSETRILLNSLELNANNNNSLRKVSPVFNCLVNPLRCIFAKYLYLKSIFKFFDLFPFLFLNFFEKAFIFVFICPY